MQAGVAFQANSVKSSKSTDSQISRELKAYLWAQSKRKKVKKKNRKKLKSKNIVIFLKLAEMAPFLFSELSP